MQKLQSGFSAHAVIIAVAVIGIITATGLIVFNRNSRVTPQAANTNSSKVDTTSSSSLPYEQALITYKNADINVQFSYPKNWTLKMAPIDMPENGKFLKMRDATLTSPSGNVLYWSAATTGGYGGSCFPAENDTPFADGNACPTRQFLKAEKLKRDFTKSEAGKYDDYLYQDDMYLVREKYRDVSDGQTTPQTKYALCLVGAESQYESTYSTTPPDGYSKIVLRL